MDLHIDSAKDFDVWSTGITEVDVAEFDQGFFFGEFEWVKPSGGVDGCSFALHVLYSVCSALGFGYS